ncbi:MAG TPA: hypothetical protein VKP30_30575 [Polyangiaceae bacterium]|nr:hypothetical protein [Polyangiaceae bacterium]
MQTENRRPSLGHSEMLDGEEYEPTIVTGVPIIDVDELTTWVARHPDGAVAKLAEVVSCI